MEVPGGIFLDDDDDEDECQVPASTAGPKVWKGVKQGKGLVEARDGKMGRERKGKAGKGPSASAGGPCLEGTCMYQLCCQPRGGC